MNITVIGSGNVATVLAKLSLHKGHNIRQIIARNLKDAEELAREVGAEACNINDPIVSQTDLIIVALSDSSLPNALSGLDFREIPVVHSAGAISMNVLKENAVNYGVLYPLQSLRKGMQVIPPIPFLIQGNNENTEMIIREFAFSLSENVRSVGEEERLRLHLAAVIVNNFTNYLYTVAEDFCIKEHVEFDLLKPLIKETADRIRYQSPAKLQTGPAVRKDTDTLEKHLTVLHVYPKWLEMYLRLTKDIQERQVEVLG